MINAWREFIWRVAVAGAIARTGTQKYVADQLLQLSWEELLHLGIGYSDLNYTRAKGRMLERIYWSQAEEEAAVSKLNTRSKKAHSSVSIQLRGGVKDSRAQGYCMQNMVITLTPDLCTVDIYYRSTEVIRKFLADLIFFSEKFPRLFERIGRTPSVIRFKFANAYLSAMFSPIFLRYEKDREGFFEHLEVDPAFYRTFTLTVRRFQFPSDHNYTFKARIKMAQYYQEHVTLEKPLVRMLSTLKGKAPTEEDDDDE